MRMLILAIPLLVVLLFLGCVHDGAQPKSVRMADILANPEDYAGKEILIDGRYGGWSTELPCDYENMAMKTRSDTIIYDDTGCLYMTGGVQVLYKEGDLNPWDNESIGRRIRIKAVVHLINGRPILGG